MLLAAVITAIAGRICLLGHVPQGLIAAAVLAVPVKLIFDSSRAIFGI